MHIPSRIIRHAKDYALHSFSALAEQTVVEADTLTTRAMGGAHGVEMSNLVVVRGFLRGEARTLRARMDRHFAGLLDRAMITMHAYQHRGSPQEIDYNTLTLIDDDVVTSQIEIERMVGRLRDAEPVELGRVNLTIAIMHNDREARERENPFRPYLLARALYEALRELMWEESQSKLLYDSLGIAMANRLPGFYAGILEVFESGGITARLTARPSAVSKVDSERAAWKRAAQQMRGYSPPGVRVTPLTAEQQQVQDRLLPKLERLNGLQTGGDGMGARKQDLVDVIWDIFHKPKGTRVPRPERGGEREPLDLTLLGLQQEIAAGMAPPAPLALYAMLDASEVGPEHKRIMDVVALLFESVVADDMVGAPMQRQLARLYLPFVRAALQYPELLYEAQHPVRRLLDRLGSVGAGVPPASPCHAGVQQEVHNIVGSVLDLFDDDLHLFGDSESALDSHVSALLAGADGNLYRGDRRSGSRQRPAGRHRARPVGGAAAAADRPAPGRLHPRDLGARDQPPGQRG